MKNNKRTITEVLCVIILMLQPMYYLYFGWMLCVLVAIAIQNGGCTKLKGPGQRDGHLACIVIYFYLQCILLVSSSRLNYISTLNDINGDRNWFFIKRYQTKLHPDMYIWAPFFPNVNTNTWP